MDRAIAKEKLSAARMVAAEVVHGVTATVAQTAAVRYSGLVNSVGVTARLFSASAVVP